jgi:hypothetical protein
MRFDKNIQMLLENNDSEYDNISKDEISVGSRDKKKTETKESSSKDTKTSKSKKNQSNDLMDFGAISIGSKTKGSKPEMNVGKKNKI